MIIFLKQGTTGEINEAADYGMEFLRAHLTQSSVLSNDLSIFSNKITV